MSKNKCIHYGVVNKIFNNSLSVVVSRRVKHPILKKYYNKTSKFLVHDENGSASVGDNIGFVSSRPISKNKSHVFHSVVVN